jgi:hypothetical protein
MSETDIIPSCNVSEKGYSQYTYVCCLVEAKVIECSQISTIDCIQLFRWCVSFWAEVAVEEWIQMIVLGSFDRYAIVSKDRLGMKGLAIDLR